MTHHYTVEIISKEVFFKATYRNGKFRKLEHLKGKLTRELMDSLGRIIPITEQEIEILNKKWFTKVNYLIVTRDKSIYTQFLEQWDYFYSTITNVPPKFTGADGNALKQIIAYLKKINGGIEEEALNNWILILESWDNLKAFHKENTDLKYINSKLNVIIREIQQKNGNTSGTDSSVAI